MIGRRGAEPRRAGGHVGSPELAQQLADRSLDLDIRRLGFQERRRDSDRKAGANQEAGT